MKSNIKYFVFGAVFSLILTFGFNSFAAIADVAFNSINIRLNGDTKASVGDSYKLNNGNSVPYSILYKGTTYLPMRKIADLVGKDITWDGDTMTAGINNKSIINPIEWSNITIKTNSGYTKAYGEVKNIDSINHSFSIVITYFDMDGKIMGTGMDFISDLQPGQVKTFEAGSIEDFSTFKTYKLQIE
jgi:hypothetical protein